MTSTPSNQPVWVVGVGPGDPAYVTQRAASLIADADLVAGFALPLETASLWLQGERMLLEYRNQEAALRTLGERAAAGQRCVVCAQGDPSVSAGELVSRVQAVWPHVEVLPGVSSVLVASARAGLALEESLFITFHKRGDTALDQEELLAEARRGRRNLIVLPRPWDFMPSAIAQSLVDGGVDSGRSVNVYQRLTLPGESACELTLGELAAATTEFSDLSIIVIPKVTQRD